MRKIYVTFNGSRIDAGSIIEKSRDAIEKMGVDLDKIDDTAALFLAANVQQKTVPELLGF